MEEIKSTENIPQPVLNSLSINPILRDLSYSPMNDLSPILDPYRDFRCNPIHVLSHGVSPVLEECLCDMSKRRDKKYKCNADERKLRALILINQEKGS